jgi:hypothetical protein
MCCVRPASPIWRCQEQHSEVSALALTEHSHGLSTAMEKVS